MRYRTVDQIKQWFIDHKLDPNDNILNWWAHRMAVDMIDGNEDIDNVHFLLDVFKNGWKPATLETVQTYLKDTWDQFNDNNEDDIQLYETYIEATLEEYVIFAHPLLAKELKV